MSSCSLAMPATPSGRFTAASLVLELDIVVIFGPVVTDQQQQTLPSQYFTQQRCSQRKARHAA